MAQAKTAADNGGTSSEDIGLPDLERFLEALETGKLSDDQLARLRAVLESEDA